MMISGEFPRHDEHKDFVRHNCSGKHSGFLALAKFLGEDVADYLKPESKIQQLVLDEISRLYEYPREKIVISTDGCSAPNFGIPMKYTALAFLKLANGMGENDDDIAILRRIKGAMTEFPEMFSGEGRFDLALMRSFPNNIICKVGAEAIEGIGFSDPPIGIAVKIYDGNQRALYPVCIEVLCQLGILTDIKQAEFLYPFYKAEIRNNMNILTGYVKAEFDLKKV
jgi:L-asparaginase II